MALPPVEVKIQGFNRVRNLLRALASAHPDITDPVIERHTKKEAKRLRGKAYPPRLPNQKYVRTGKLGRSFRAQQIKKGSWRVINRVKGPRGKAYAIWVVKKGFQARGIMGGRKVWAGHKGRWWTIDDEIQNNIKPLTQELTRILEETEG